jgi:hypothetical protein
MIEQSKCVHIKKYNFFRNIRLGIVNLAMEAV